eukprot:TRINITY_DN10381_c0_g1_i1.p1 TRINITY_DN10381_c0_g1~~TRINITY_DN10381_c0_g1_i1.p1  ORF type:complete len:282 (-),score=31.91 TRINITY_DN10381_c0_g1_i1:48-866(-)
MDINLRDSDIITLGTSIISIIIYIFIIRWIRRRNLRSFQSARIWLIYGYYFVIIMNIGNAFAAFTSKRSNFNIFGISILISPIFGELSNFCLSFVVCSVIIRNTKKLPFLFLTLIKSALFYVLIITDYSKEHVHHYDSSKFIIFFRNFIVSHLVTNVFHLSISITYVLACKNLIPLNQRFMIRFLKNLLWVSVLGVLSSLIYLMEDRFDVIHVNDVVVNLLQLFIFLHCVEWVCVYSLSEFCVDHHGLYPSSIGNHEFDPNTVVSLNFEDVE